MHGSALSTSICLSMIVKNEAHVLERCLRSVRPILSSWVIVDTGSTDDTEAVARRALEGIPGEFAHRPWVDFSTNRNEALDLSRQKADYSLVIDADDELEFPAGYMLPELYHDAYILVVCDSDLTYWRPHILSSARPFRYTGVVHECLVDDPMATSQLLEGVVYRRYCEQGGTWKETGNKFLRAAQLLEAALRDDPGNARHAYFLAHSYKDAGEFARAIEAYERCAKMDLDVTHRFVALLSAAELRVRLRAPMMEVLSTYLRAHACDPRNAEAMHGLSSYLWSVGENGLAHAFASAAMAIPRPSPHDVLQLREAVYGFGIVEQYSKACSNIGLVDEARKADQRLVDEGLAPPETVAEARARLGLPPVDPRWEGCRTCVDRLGTSMTCEALPLEYA